MNERGNLERLCSLLMLTGEHAPKTWREMASLWGLALGAACVLYLLVVATLVAFG